MRAIICVYLLKSLKDKKGYIGSTVNLLARFKQHCDGRVQSTKNRRPLLLVAYREFVTIQEACFYEKKYKKSHDVLNKHIMIGLFRSMDVDILNKS